MDRERLTKWASIVVSVVMLLVGLGMVGLGYSAMQNQSQALSDPVNVTGEVVNTEIDTVDNAKGISYQPELTYAYQFKNTTYTSSYMYPGGQSANRYNMRRGAEAVVQTYNEGATVSVWVPPEAPDEGYLKHKKTTDPFVFLLGGTLLAGANAYRLVGREWSI